MDQMRSVGPDHGDDADGQAIDDRPPSIGHDERRMHVRAYNFWTSLLDGRAYPTIADLDPAAAGDFGDHALLLDFTRDERDPSITYVGEALREACGVAESIATVSDVPSRTLLSRLTDHYLQIIANRAPIGFEAEFVDQRAVAMLYRGILMPFSSDGEHIDHVYGVINWKTLAAPADVGAPAPPPLAGPVPSPSAAPWADGPGATLAGGHPPSPLAERLAVAQDAAVRAEAAWVDCRATLHRALGLAYDLMLAAADAPDDYSALRASAAPGRRSIPRDIVTLAFGTTIEARRAVELADVLACARRRGVPPGGLARHLDGERGGVRALMAAERLFRAERLEARARRVLETVPPASPTPAIEEDGRFALLLARRGPSGQTELIGQIADGSPLVGDAIREIARAPRAAA